MFQQNFVEKVGDYIADICYLACKHKVKLEPSFINAALAVEIMEGYDVLLLYVTSGFPPTTIAHILIFFLCSIATALYRDLQVRSVALPMIIKAEMMHRLPSFSLS